MFTEIDLSKSDRHFHPDIKPDGTLYLIQLSDGPGSWFFGPFTRQWYGLSFSRWGNAGLQFDAPGFNSSRWTRVFEFDPDATANADDIVIKLPIQVFNEIKQALQFYADQKNYIDTPSWDGDPTCITPSAIPMIRGASEDDPAPRCDCGDTANAAMKFFNRADNDDSPLLQWHEAQKHGWLYSAEVPGGMLKIRKLDEGVYYSPTKLDTELEHVYFSTFDECRKAVEEMYVSKVLHQLFRIEADSHISLRVS